MRRNFLKIIFYIIFYSSCFADNNEIPFETALKDIKEKNINALIDLVKNGLDINYVNDANITLLHIAAMKNNFEIVKYLIANGAKINTKDIKNWTPLHYSINYSGDNTETVKYLIDNGADVNASAGKKPGYVLYEGMNQNLTPLHLAASKRSIEIVQILVTHGAKINVSNYLGYTPFHIALSNSSIEIVKYLMLNGADVNTREISTKNTPLHIAVSTSNKDLAKFLIENKADVNSKNANGESPLHIAGIKELFFSDILISNGADVNISDNNGNTPLHIAAQKGNYKVIELLINKGAIINKKNSEGFYPLDMALYECGRNKNRDKEKIFKILLENNAIWDKEKNRGDIFYNTPVNWALSYGMIDVAKLLINRNQFDINVLDSYYNYTPLHYAVEMGNIELVKFLLSKGADINIKGKYTLLAWDIARARDYEEIAKLVKPKNIVDTEVSNDK